MSPTMIDLINFAGMIAVPIVALSSAGIVLVSVVIIFRMDGDTHHGVRLFYTTAATGAFGELFSLLTGRASTVYELLLALAVGFLFLFDRRGYSPRTTLRKLKGKHDDGTTVDRARTHPARHS